MGNTSSGPFVDLFGETVVAESAEKAARWALASSFIDLAGVFFPAFGLENVLLLPRATVLQRGRRMLPTYPEAAKGLRSTAEVSCCLDAHNLNSCAMTIFMKAYCTSLLRCHKAKLKDRVPIHLGTH
jgi:hypothetical protein